MARQKLRCPHCDGESRQTKSSARAGGYYERRYQCKVCRSRWSSAEVPIAQGGYERALVAVERRRRRTGEDEW